MDGICAKLLRKNLGEGENITSKSKVDLACLSTCHSTLQQHLQRVNNGVALHKPADETILEKPKPYSSIVGSYRYPTGAVRCGWGGVPPEEGQRSRDKIKGKGQVAPPGG